MSEDKLEIGVIISRTAILYGKAIEAKLDESKIDLNIHQLMLLSLLTTKDHKIQQDLADYMKKDKSAVLRAIDVLEEKKIITRTADADDRRKKIIHITRSGLNLLEHAREVEREVLEKMQAGLSEAEIKTYAKVSLQMQRNATT